jgi:hypothetical protein
MKLPTVCRLSVVLALGSIFNLNFSFNSVFAQSDRRFRNGDSARSSDNSGNNGRRPETVFNRSMGNSGGNTANDSTSTFNRPDSTVNRSNFNRDRSNVNDSRPYNSVSRQGFIGDRPDVNVNRPDSNFSRPNVNVNQSDVNVNRSYANFNRSEVNVNRQNFNRDRSDLNVNRPDLNFSRPNVNVNVNRQDYNFNRPNVNVYRPDFNNRPNFNGDRRDYSYSRDYYYNRPSRPVVNVNRTTINVFNNNPGNYFNRSRGWYGGGWSGRGYYTPPGWGLTTFISGLVIGAILTSPPPYYTPLYVGSSNYIYSDGVFLQPTGSQYVVVSPPIGAIVSALPEGCTQVDLNYSVGYDCSGVVYEFFYQGSEPFYRVVRY